MKLAVSGGGYGQGNSNGKPATGTLPGVNPFMIPKQSGLSWFTQVYPDQYYVDWDLTTWRIACDQAQKQGFPVSYAALVNWCFEASTFIQSLFTTMEDGVIKMPCYLVDDKGNKNEQWTAEICAKKWFQDLRKEICSADLWGFIGLNFDPIGNKIYKYPMSSIDPINRLLRQSTYNFTDGVYFAEKANLLFVQPSTSYERFLGKMQPIAREFIMMNMNSMNWLQAGRRLAFPLLSIGYPGESPNITDKGNLISPFKLIAEEYAANLDPSKSLITPYTIDRDGNKQYALDLITKDTSGKQNAHKIYQEFNSDQKNDIRELVYGGTLTSSIGKSGGSYSASKTHENKLKTALEARNEEILAVLNDENDFLKKIRLFYKNFPDNLHFDTNRTKEWTIDEVALISDSVSKNGLKLTKPFYVKLGLDSEDIDEAPEPVKSSFDSETLSVEFDKGKRSLFGSKKKVLESDLNT